ncbi:hypothetical protein K443DRAFT_444107 [Laccaria amethystina LaAM-08-1]|uniref:Uncharacterized protein n=1 Tax=Laccaria amethystina LaAM-08-1 TaxID=1095629 RepID=A0A0C9X728_9AGAR|nr:hypothetical protein K443DRAFT_444107 [Laccaria amethystina LaAM-08-1]
MFTTCSLSPANFYKTSCCESRIPGVKKEYLVLCHHARGETGSTNIQGIRTSGDLKMKSKHPNTITKSPCKAPKNLQPR